MSRSVCSVALAISSTASNEVSIQSLLQRYLDGRASQRLHAEDREADDIPANVNLFHDSVVIGFAEIAFSLVKHDL